MKKEIFYSLTTLLMLASCSADDAVSTTDSLRAKLQLGVVVEEMESRVGSNEHNAFDINDDFGVSVYSEGKTIVNNKMMVLQSSTIEEDDSQLLSAVDGESLGLAMGTNKIVCTSPFISDFGATNTLTIPADQTTIENYRKADICAGTYSLSNGLTFGTSSKTVNATIPMKHMTTKIIVRVVNSDSYPTATANSYTFKVNHVPTTFDLKYNSTRNEFSTSFPTGEETITGTIPAGGGAGCCLVPQTVVVAQQKNFITVTDANGNTWSYTMSSTWNDDFGSGRAYEFVLRLNKPGVGTSEAELVQANVVDWNKVTDTFDIELNH